MLRAHAETTRGFNADLVAEHDLTLSDYEVLLRLAHAPDRRLRRIDLAEEVLLTPSGITRLLAGLEENGWVERASCDSDARVTYAQLTDAGLEKLRVAAKSHVASIRSLFAERFSPSELEALRDLLQRLPLAEGASCEP
ncbi:MAG TPA: MarR family transcriptional regulator [Gaiellaceae bacterium]|nr:MarR family transcriptional regulator [Gaiellaceae bacterium]